MSAIQIFDCEQNSNDWLRARMGIPTASMFATVCANGKDGGASVTRKNYMLKLAGEIITGEPMENYTNSAMERGHAMEDEARSLYAFLQDELLQRVGFVRNGDKGCSPDSFVGSDGMVEIKTCQPNVLAEIILRNKFPSEHVPQCAGGIWVCERKWLDIVCYWPKMPVFMKRLYRDDETIKWLDYEVTRFNAELAEAVERIRSYRADAA
jgi:YqaJ-like viral recombinase domain